MQRTRIPLGVACTLLFPTLLAGAAWAQSAAAPAPKPAEEQHALMCVPLPRPDGATAIDTPESKPCELSTPIAAGEPCTCGPIVGKVEDMPLKVPMRD